MKQTCDRLDSCMASLCKGKRILKDRITYTEAQSMRENLVLHGISESEGEKCVDVVKHFCKTELDLDTEFVDNLIIDRAHRIDKISQRNGPNAMHAHKLVNQHTRPIVVKFHKYGDKEQVWEMTYSRRIQLKQKQERQRPKATIRPPEKKNTIPCYGARKG